MNIPRPWDPSVPTWAIRTSFVVVLVWIALGGVFVQTAPAFLDHAGSHMGDPPGTRAGNARGIRKAYFMTNPSNQLLAVFVDAKGAQLNLTAIEQYSRWLNETVLESDVGKAYQVHVEGYFLPTDGVAPTWMLQNTSTVFQLYATRKPHGMSTWAPVVFMESVVADERGKSLLPPSYTVGLTGNPAESYQVKGASVKSLRRMEVIVVPFAFAVLACFLKKLQLLIIPLLTIGLSLGAAFSISLPMAMQWSSVSSDDPSVMVSTAAALSIDYSLFMLSRFMEGVSLNTPIWKSILDMQSYAGHTVVVSGSLIALAFFSALLMPITSFRMAGACAGLTAIITVFTNLTLTPAMLVLFSRPLLANLVPARVSDFFSAIFSKVLIHRVRPKWCCCRTDDDQDEEYVFDGDECGPSCDPSAPLVLNSSPLLITTDHRNAEPAWFGSVWFKLACKVRKYPLLTIFIVLVLGTPFIYQLKYLRVSEARSLTHARGAEAEHVMEEMGATQGYLLGRFNPFQLVYVAEGTFGVHGVFSEAGFKALHEVGDRVLAVTDIPDGIPPYRALNGPAHAWDTALSFQEALELIEAKNSSYSSLLSETLSFTNGSYFPAMRTLVYTPFDSFSDVSAAWIRTVRSVIDDYNAQHTDIKVYLDGDACFDLDTAASMREYLPRSLGVILGGVMLAVTLIFRSIFLPVRLAFALSFTIAVTLGISVVVFQTRAFWWAMPYLRHYSGDGLAFTVPPIVIPVAVSLGLDYDIFLITRIVEYRMKGFADDVAVVMGVGKTGSIISGAGVIMTIAFGGLLASSVVELNQMGIILCISVLIDTFVVRTVMVPALMIMASQWNWWPRKMPEICRLRASASLVEVWDQESCPQSPASSRSPHARYF